VKDLEHYMVGPEPVNKLFFMTLFYYLALILILWELILLALRLIRIRSKHTLPFIVCFSALLGAALFNLQGNFYVAGKYDALFTVVAAGCLAGALQYFIENTSAPKKPDPSIIKNIPNVGTFQATPN
jgi:hypothetical protein